MNVGTARRVALRAFAGLLSLVALTGCVPFTAEDDGDVAGCRESVRKAEATVYTSRWESAGDLPDLGDYPDIHWQVRALGDPCSRAPGPTDWAYQGVVRLRPADAERLADRYAFEPYDTVEPTTLPDTRTPADAWPALASLLPAQAHWSYSRSYNELPAPRWRTVFLDVPNRTLFFLLNDH
jgi:hypothetical protein